MDGTKLKNEKRGEYLLRLFLAFIVMLIGAGFALDSIFVSKSYNGLQILVGLELLGGSYLVLTLPDILALCK